jgi:hypothetical protein
MALRRDEHTEMLTIPGEATEILGDLRDGAEHGRIEWHRAGERQAEPMAGETAAMGSGMAG